MLALQAMRALQATLAIIAASASGISALSGSLVGYDVTASGASLSIDRGEHQVSTVQIRPHAVIRERAAGGDWQTVSLSKLMSGEPVRVRLDSAGNAVEIDAEYAIVTTRAVVVERSYLVGTDGVAHKLVGAAGTTTSSIPLGAYVRLRTDPASGAAFDATVSTHPFSETPAAAAVAVTIEVRVPANTPSSSTVYLATNAQNWTANAIRMTPEPGNRWTATVKLAGGTLLQYKYTRGSWSTGERDPAGAEISNRTLTVAGDAKAQHIDDVVARWADLPS